MFIIGNKRKNMDYEPEEEVKTSSGIFYQNEIIEFDNIESFVAKLYQENTLVVPLSSNIQVILGGKDDYEDSDIIPHDLEVDYELAEGMINENDSLTDEQKDDELKELYRTTYDYRLLNPYILKKGELTPINIKMIGEKKYRGIIGNVCNCLSWIDKHVSNIPFGLAKKWVKFLQNKYDESMVTNKGNIIKTVIWIPLYSISNTTGLYISLIDRIDIILT